MFDSEKQNSNNQKALENPRPGDYWQEMFCPYFVVVDVNNDQYTVLSCLGGPDSFTRKDEINSRVEIDSSHWGFDYSKSMTVDKEWIRKTVRYESIDGFVADVINSEKTQQIVNEWRKHTAEQYRKKIQSLQDEYEKFTGWKYLKEKVSS